MDPFVVDLPVDNFLTFQMGRAWIVYLQHRLADTMDEGAVVAFPVQAQLNGVDWGPEFTIYVKSSRPFPP